LPSVWDAVQIDLPPLRAAMAQESSALAAADPRGPYQERRYGFRRGGMSEADEEELDFFLMANLRPATTGLPMVVWVSERGLARHDVRVKVSAVHGARVQHTNMATVAVRPTPRLVAGQLSAADLQAVNQWIRLNEATLVAYWDCQIDTAELIQRLRALSPPVPP
jgi:hypothetical protein